MTAGFSVRLAALQASHSTAGARGGWRSHEPCAATTAPPDHGAGMALPSRKDMPSGALWAGSPASTGGRAAQSSRPPPGLVTESATNGTGTRAHTRAAHPAGTVSVRGVANAPPPRRAG